MIILKDQKLTYLTRRKVEVAQLKNSFGKEQINLALSVGHRLRGHGETFGFLEISLLGIQMENAARDQNISAINKVIKNLDDLVEASIRIVASEEK